MTEFVSRRKFLKSSTLAGATALLASKRAVRAAESPAETVTLGVIGVNGRGSGLASGFAGVGGARIAYVCDVDERVEVSRLVGRSGTARGSRAGGAALARIVS